MKVLQICYHLPYPLKDGGSIAMYNITKGFYDLGWDVTMLVPSTKKHPALKVSLPEEITGKWKIVSINVKTDITFWGAFLNLFSSKSYYLSRYESKPFENKLIEILKTNQFDIIHLESLKTTMYVETIRKYSDAKIVLRSHNIEFKIWERMNETSRSPLLKWYLKLLVKRLKNYELNILNKIDALVPISNVDADYFIAAGCKCPVLTIPSGIDLKSYNLKNSIGKPDSIFYIGSLDWLPNQEGLDWFIGNVWPSASERMPKLKLYIAGRNMPEKFRNMNEKNIIICGEVEDSIEFMNSYQLMIVPLLSGSGIRVKIIEGMAIGKTIITTSIGVEGIECQHNKNILIADTVEDFVNCIEKSINNNDFTESISHNAIRLIQEKYDNSVLINKLGLFYESLLK